MPSKKRPAAVRANQARQSTDFRWHLLPLGCGILFVVLAGASAWIETPTVDEFAHVPAGVAHWRFGRFDIYPHNPPLGKMWVAAPVAFDRQVQLAAPSYEQNVWKPWLYGTTFEQRNHQRYLQLMLRARLAVLPLVLLCAWLVYGWARSLFGPFPAALASSLFLLSPTILAHGHVATVDIAAMTAIFGAVLTLRGALQSGTWQRYALAGLLLGVALSVKFSALFLLLVAPALIAIAALLKSPRDSWRKTARNFAVYGLSCWFAVNLLVGFSGTFAPLGSHEFRSRPMQRISGILPSALPSMLPRDYLRGLDELQWETATLKYPTYLAGAPRPDGSLLYYPVALGIKETEPVVILVVLALLLFWFSRVGIGESLVLVLPAATFLFIAIFLNPLALGIRYILPAFPFFFVMIAGVLSIFERRFPRPAINSAWTRDRRFWLAVPLLAYTAVIMIAVFPGYLSYFNAFIGGSKNGPDWLLDSNFDWGQDLYQIARLAQENDVEPHLLYFGHVDESIYGFRSQEVTDRPELGLYAISANYWYGMPYMGRSAPGWTAQLVPTDRLGSIFVFDLRLPPSLESAGAPQLFNTGLAHLMRGTPQPAVACLRAAVERHPQWIEARLQYALALDSLGQTRQAVEQYRHTLELWSDAEPALNNLAWHLSTSEDPNLRDPAEAVRLAQRACELTGHENLSFLDTLIQALLADGQPDRALAVAQEGLDRAIATDQPEAAERFRQTRANLAPHEATP